MYDRVEVGRLVELIHECDGIGDKRKLRDIVQEKLHLTKDGTIYYHNSRRYAIRFCRAKCRSFSNTVLALSRLQKYDCIPFIVCVVTPEENYLLLANSTFLRKVSHSSQELRIDNIKGSFNGSDIMREFEGVENSPENFEFLFTSHENYTFEENLARLVEATNNIQPTGKKFLPNEQQKACIEKSVERAVAFMSSEEYHILDEDLRRRVNAVAPEIVIAAFIDNVNLRGRIIEHLITSEYDLQSALITALHDGSALPPIYTADKLGDYERDFDNFSTATDIKTKILFLSSNPKGYNIDKLLSFLAKDDSVYLIFVVAIDENKKISTRLCSMFNRQILNGTRIIKHWAGRNSRGVTQYDGTSLENIISDFDPCINISDAKRFIKTCIDS